MLICGQAVQSVSSPATVTFDTRMAPPKAAVLVPLALLAAMAFRGNQVGLWDHLAKNLDAHTLVNDDSLPLFSSFTGIPFLDEVFKALVSFFWSVLGPNASFLHRFFVFDFFVSWLPVVLAMYVEAIRGSNANTLLALCVCQSRLKCAISIRVIVLCLGCFQCKPSLMPSPCPFTPSQLHEQQRSTHRRQSNQTKSKLSHQLSFSPSSYPPYCSSTHIAYFQTRRIKQS